MTPRQQQLIEAGMMREEYARLYGHVDSAAYRLFTAREGRAQPASERVAPITYVAVKAAVAGAFNMSVDAIDGKARHREVAVARMVAMYLGRKLTNLSFPSLGRRTGGRDHTTAIHACQRIEAMMEADATFAATIADIERGILS